MKQLAIPLVELLAIPLSCQKTATKWLVISNQKTVAKWLVISGKLGAELTPLRKLRARVFAQQDAAHRNHLKNCYAWHLECARGPEYQNKICL